MFLKLLADSTRRAVCTRRAMTWGCHITCPLCILLLSGKMTSDLKFWIKTALKHQKYSKFKQTWVRMFKVPPPVSRDEWNVRGFRYTLPSDLPGLSETHTTRIRLFSGVSLCPWLVSAQKPAQQEENCSRACPTVLAAGLCTAPSETEAVLEDAAVGAHLVFLLIK